MVKLASLRTFPRPRRLSAVLAGAVGATTLSLIGADSSSAATQTFSNSNPMVITSPNGGPPGGQEPGCPNVDTPYNNSCHPSAATPWPSSITVSGVAGQITDVNVRLHGLWADFPADIDMVLVGPGGAPTVVLMSDACGESDGPKVNPIPQASAITVTFSDGAPGLPEDGVCTTGTFAPVDDDIVLNLDGSPVGGNTDGVQFPFMCCDSFAAITGNPTITFLPPPTVSPSDPNEGVSLSAFNGMSANGTWALYLVSDTPAPAGSPSPGGITLGWSLEITTAASRPVGDFDGNATTDVAVYRPSTGQWFVQGGLTAVWGTGGDVPVPGDYNGNATTDVAVYRPSTGQWFVQGGLTAVWGTGGDVPVPGDFDGNATTDVAVYRPSTGEWFVQGGLTAVWGTGGDVPVPGDYNGNGTTDVAVYRPSTGEWFVQGGLTAVWGTAGDVPVPGDYNGNGTTDVAVYRPSTGEWFVQGGLTAVWGTAGDVPVPGDYNGNGTTDVAVYRPSTGEWFVQGGLTTVFGTGDDIPIPRAPSL